MVGEFRDIILDGTPARPHYHFYRRDYEFVFVEMLYIADEEEMFLGIRKPISDNAHLASNDGVDVAYTSYDDL